MKSCPSGPDRPSWLDANDTELIKLVLGTNTITPVLARSKSPTCCNPVPKEKWAKGNIVRRVRSCLGETDVGGKRPSPRHRL
jgi:hypothetical protein